MANRFIGPSPLLPDMANLNLFEMLPRLDVPVFLLQGRHDYVAHVMPAALPATGGRIDVHQIGGDTCPNSAHCATVSLGRLWQQQGKKDQARRMLADIYSWFTEGFDTLDLQ